MEISCLCKLCNKAVENRHNQDKQSESREWERKREKYIEWERQLRVSFKRESATERSKKMLLLDAFSKQPLDYGSDQNPYIFYRVAICNVIGASLALWAKPFTSAFKHFPLLHLMTPERLNNDEKLSLPFIYSFISTSFFSPACSIVFFKYTTAI